MELKRTKTATRLERAPELQVNVDARQVNIGDQARAVLKDLMDNEEVVDALLDDLEQQTVGSGDE